MSTAVAVAVTPLERFIDRLREVARKGLNRLHKDVKSFLVTEQAYVATLSEHDIDVVCNEVCDLVDTDPIRKAWALATGLMPKEIYNSDATYKWYIAAEPKTRQEIDTKFKTATPIEVRVSPTAAPKFIKPSKMTTAQLNAWKPCKSPVIRTIEEQTLPVKEPFNYHAFERIEQDKKAPERLLIRGENNVVIVVDKLAYDTIVSVGKSLMGW
jgi:hypothetical protein